MKALIPVLMSMFGLGLLSISGCTTTQPGTTDTLGSYSTNVSGAPDAVTAAATHACEDLKFAAIASASTKVDGRVTARTAQGNDITIVITQSGDNVSKVSVRVGPAGDELISQQILDHIRKHISSV